MNTQKKILCESVHVYYFINFCTYLQSEQKNVIFCPLFAVFLENHEKIRKTKKNVWPAICRGSQKYKIVAEKRIRQMKKMEEIEKKQVKK